MPTTFWIALFFCVAVIAAIWGYLMGRDRQDKRGRHWDV